jgi:hypothetical protein
MGDPENKKRGMGRADESEKTDGQARTAGLKGPEKCLVEFAVS